MFTKSRKRGNPICNRLGQIFLIVDLQNFFSDLGSGDKKNEINKL